jgi:hypothetical protein
MKTTQDCIAYISTHPWIKKSFAKLNKADIDFIIAFFNRDITNRDDAMLICNRLFMDQVNKPKNWKIISELISCGITFRY